MNKNELLAEFQRLQSERNQLDELVQAQGELLQIIRTASSGEEAWPLGLDIAIRVSGMDSGGIYFIDEQSRTLRLAYRQGLEQEYIRMVAQYTVDNPGVRKMLAGEPFYSIGTEIGDSGFPEHNDITFMAVLPVRDQNKIIGCIYLTSHVLTALSENTRTILETIAEDIGGIAAQLCTANELQKSSVLLAEAQRLGKTGHWEWTAPDSKILCSEEYFRLLEIPHQKKYISHQTIYEMLDLDELQRLKKLDHDAFAAQTDPDYEFRIRTADGNMRRLHQHVYVTYGSDGQPQRMLGIVQEITERKQAERQFQELLLRQNAILAAVPDIIMEVNDNKVYTWANRAGMAFFGDNVIGKEASYYFEGELDIYKEIDPLFQGSEEVLYIESWQRRQDGEKRLLAWWCRVLKDVKGNVNGALSTARDITAHRQAEEKLRESEERFRSLFEASNVIMLIIDPDSGQIVDANLAASRYYGYTRGQLGSMNIGEINSLPPEQVAEERQRAKREERNYFIFPHRLANGTIRNVEVHSQPCILNGKVLLYSIIFDITERKQAEERLQESEETYRSILEASPDGIAISDLDGRILMLPPRTMALLGYSKQDELLGRKVLEFIVPEDQERAASNISLMFRGLFKGSAEYRLLSAEGTEFQTEINAEYIRGSDGQPTKMVFVIRDITERKRAEKEKAKLQEQLAQAQKIESVGRLAGGVAHDFNNLLTVINGYSELMLMANLPEQLRNPIIQIKYAGDRAQQLTSQLLAFSRKQVIQPKIINLNTLIADHMKMLGRLLGEDIEISTQLPKDLANIKADPGQIEQIIMNLVINSRDAMPFGGRILIETDNVEFDENYVRRHVDSRPGKYVMLAISDNGTGMDEATKEKIFEPFFTTKGRDKGTGLGLATVFGVVKQNEGFIYVYSELNKGTSFKIYLPALEPTEAAETEQTAAQQQLEGTETILLVEDNPEVLELTQMTLSGYGYQVITARNGEEGLQVFREYQGTIDLLLTDVIMPVMGGKELADKLKAEYPYLKVIYFSGYTDESIVHHGVLETGAEFIQKPYSNKELAKKIRDVLDH